jgi:hypothetical protein
VDEATIAILIDITNAYGAISREAMLSALYQHEELRPLWNIAHWTLAAPALRAVRMDDGSMRYVAQTTGGPQGSLIMPALFAVALQPILEQETRGLETAAILDDIATGGKAAMVFAAFDRLKARIKSELGAEINPSKCIAVLGYASDVTEEIRLGCETRGIKLQPDGAVYVGGFIGRNKEQQREHVLKVATRHQTLFDALTAPGMPVQIAVILARSVCMPKLIHLIRGMKPEVTEAGAAHVDRQIRVAMAKLLNSTELVDDSSARGRMAYAQMTLPLRHGGLGLTSLVRILSLAYMSSIAQAAQDLPQYFHGMQARVQQIRNSALSEAHAAKDTKRIADLNRHAPAAQSDYVPPGTAADTMAALGRCVEHAKIEAPGLFESNIAAATAAAASAAMASAAAAEGDAAAEAGHAAAAAAFKPADRLLPSAVLEFFAMAAALPGDTDKMQSSLSTAAHLKLRDMLMRALDAAGQARLLSCSGPGSSRAFLVVPRDDHHSLYHRFAAAYAYLSRLGLLATESITPDTRCICGTLIHSDPAHFNTCTKLRRLGNLNMHNHVCRTWNRLAEQCGLIAQGERTLPSGKKTDGEWHGMAQVYGWDFSSTTAMAKSVCDSASKTPGYAIKVREFAKFAKYNAECKRQGVAFLPLVMEVHGTMSRTVHSAAEMLAEYGATSGAPSPPSKQDILNQLAVALQKGQMLLMHQGVTKLRHAQRLKAFK